jgi:hypothetical protein
MHREGAAATHSIRIPNATSDALRWPARYRPLHWYVTVLVPFAFVTMFETTCCDPLFLQ